ncbi:MAG TPA: rhodanese-like domain-containing protein [Armatimonadota bacterium]|nr:rhodanese-like domain-containing protein [Armatimonadota bacterium]HOS42651.1 rhodanese-like domain-containing protein [Armatimonadota bacterium]
MTPTREVREISRQALVDKRRRGEAYVLVDVLAHEHFVHRHLPGAINVPLHILRDLAPLLFGEHDEIIVYCANTACAASATAAKILGGLGFTNVYDYAGGIKDWEEAGEAVLAHGALVTLKG